MSTALAFEPEPVPLTGDAAGRLMIAGTRVPLESLMAAFKRGESPEAIHESYDTVKLADIYVVLAYYLHHGPTSSRTSPSGSGETRRPEHGSRPSTRPTVSARSFWPVWARECSLSDG